jgi:small subunit ribosomal protein S17
MEKRSKKRQLKGEVVSDKMQKTAVILVRKIKTDPLYRKRIRLSRRFKADNPDNKFKVGDFVIIEECRPLSREKRWRIIGKTRELI